ncbi:MAG: UDP-N-acetylglucosamine 2-epimerase (hydrolyzing) [Lachnospiraceae bacterium]|nr:UDP-N-acetylglucosamine 2-epimerase (hydrolyzing) [Lachnospiraceae bacterium]
MVDKQKKICFVTAARSEYGLLKWLMKDVSEDPGCVFQLIVTGGHLLKEQGHTIDEIVNDGFRIDAIIDAGETPNSDRDAAWNMGKIAEGVSDAIHSLQPDLLFVLGDRYELLPICSSAFLMHIPIAHISGGDVTEGAIDDGIRNAVSMLATYHFPGTEEAAKRLEQMRGNQENIWRVGEPGLDAFFREDLLSRETLAESLGLNVEKKWILMTFHPETKQNKDYSVRIVNGIMSLLGNRTECQVVCTYANTDVGGKEINLELRKAESNYDNVFVIPSLGQKRYLSMMNQVDLLIGNSSSGITEAPSLGVPVVNIGNRQKGRYQCSNVIQSGGSLEEISGAIDKAMQMKRGDYRSDYWGDGKTSERILEIMKNRIFMD